MADELIRQFGELSEAQDAKLKVQEEGVDMLRLEAADARLDREAQDILGMASEAEILAACEQYAEAQGIPLLAAKVQILQYLSPEWKEKVDEEVYSYLIETDLLSIPVELLKTFRDEGYIAQIVIAINYPEDRESREKYLEKRYRIYNRPGKTFEREFKKIQDADLSESEAEVVYRNNLDKGAKKYLVKLKRSDPETYAKAVKLVHIYLEAIELIHLYFSDGCDCDEISLMVRGIVQGKNLPVGDYFNISGHIALKIDGFPLILDPFDRKVRHIDEFASMKRNEAPSGSYFYRDAEGYYLAEYQDGEITGYRRATDTSYVVQEYEDVAGLMADADQNNPEMFKLALAICPTSSIVHNNYASYFREQGDYEGAEKHFRKAIELDPYNTAALRGFGNIYSDREDFDKAEQYLRKVVQINPNDIDALNTLAVILLDQGKSDEAAQYSERASNLNPESLDSILSRAYTLEDQGLFEQAGECYRQVFELDPNDPVYAFNLAQNLYRQKKYEESRVYLREFLELRSGSEYQEYYDFLNQKLANQGF